MALDPQKEKILEDWGFVMNTIIKAEEGEMRVTYVRTSDLEGGEGAALVDNNKIEGVFVELLLRFQQPMPEDFTIEEIEAVKKALSGISENEKIPDK